MSAKGRGHHRGGFPLLRKYAAGLCFAAVLMLAVGSSDACRRGKGEVRNPPNIIIILIDALRADSLHDYGNARKTDPFLEEFGRKGVRFTNAHSHSSLTKISVASLFSGLLPPAHGVRNAALRSKKSPGKIMADVLSPGLTTLTEVLREKKYATAAVINNPHLDLSSGFTQGFQDYMYIPDPTARAEVLNKAALDWLGKIPPGPFFLYLHYMDIHTPYDPPPAYRRLYSEEKPYPPIQKNGRWFGPIPREQVEYTKALYDAQINYWDDCFRSFVAGLRAGGRLDNTLFVILADHGEEFYDHAGFGHGHTGYEEMLRVPLYLIYEGRIPPGQARTDPVQIVDIFPTMCRFAGGDCRRLDLHGKDLFASKKGRRGPRVHYAETNRGLSPRSVQTQNFKLIYNSKRNKYELYDLFQDPKELKNIYRDGLPAGEPLKVKLKQILATRKAGLKTQTRELDPKSVELLKSLGYIK